MQRMKGNIGAILREEQERYLVGLLPARDPVAAAMEAAAEQSGVPIVDPEVGLFLYLVARSSGARRILEVGTATGYSGLWLARALPPDGRLVTIDVDPERQRQARESWTAAGLADRVETHLGPALDVLPTLAGPFDLVFIDAEKPEYQGYLERALPLLRPGAVILVDNTLWMGEVARGEHTRDADAIRAFNAFVMQHPRITAEVVPVGDGVLYGILE
jgi:caffeoyl-CoA O-methyltransferase